jgi:hypothetical protein
MAVISLISRAGTRQGRRITSGELGETDLPGQTVRGCIVVDYRTVYRIKHGSVGDPDLERDPHVYGKPERQKMCIEYTILCCTTFVIPFYYGSGNMINYGSGSAKVCN